VSQLAPATAPAYAPTRLPSKIQSVGIVIPVRNHANVIAKCIAGLFAANSYSGWNNSIWIVVVADGSTDDTAKMARQALGAFGQVLEISAHSRQTANRLGAAALIEHFRNVPPQSLLLTSRDATAELPLHWIDQQLKSSRSLMGLASDY
jgi:cellulose synthase/poly-beta-1,6-N-acetylglucosamine synthase-like glycosyltransferase